MDDFNLRREEYFNKLRSNTEIVEALINEDNNSKTKQILLNPKTIRELNIAEAYFQTISDLKDLLINIMNDNIKPIKMEDSYIVDYFIRLIKALKNVNQEEVNKCYLELNELTAKDAAKMVYEMMVVLSREPEEAISFVAEESGFDTCDEVDVARFQLCMDEANKIANNRKIVDLDSLDMEKDDEVNNAIIFSNEFHKLYEEGKIDKDYNPLPPYGLKITFK